MDHEATGARSRWTSSPIWCLGYGQLGRQSPGVLLELLPSRIQGLHGSPALNVCNIIWGPVPREREQAPHPGFSSKCTTCVGHIRGKHQVPHRGVRVREPGRRALVQGCIDRAAWRLMGKGAFATQRCSCRRSPGPGSTRTPRTCARPPHGWWPTAAPPSTTTTRRAPLRWSRASTTGTGSSVVLPYALGGRGGSSRREPSGGRWICTSWPEQETSPRPRSRGWCDTWGQIGRTPPPELLGACLDGLAGLELLSREARRSGPSAASARSGPEGRRGGEAIGNSACPCARRGQVPAVLKRLIGYSNGPTVAVRAVP